MNSSEALKLDSIEKLIKEQFLVFAHIMNETNTLNNNFIKQTITKQFELFAQKEITPLAANIHKIIKQILSLKTELIQQSKRIDFLENAVIGRNPNPNSSTITNPYRENAIENNQQSAINRIIDMTKAIEMKESVLKDKYKGKNNGSKNITNKTTDEYLTNGKCLKVRIKRLKTTIKKLTETPKETRLNQPLLPKESNINLKQNHEISPTCKETEKVAEITTQANGEEKDKVAEINESTSSIKSSKLNELDNVLDLLDNEINDIVKEIKQEINVDDEFMKENFEKSDNEIIEESLTESDNEMTQKICSDALRLLFNTENQVKDENLIEFENHEQQLFCSNEPASLLNGEKEEKHDNYSIDSDMSEVEFRSINEEKICEYIKYKTEINRQGRPFQILFNKPDLEKIQDPLKRRYIKNRFENNLAARLSRIKQQIRFQEEEKKCNKLDEKNKELRKTKEKLEGQKVFLIKKLKKIIGLELSVVQQ